MFFFFFLEGGAGGRDRPSFKGVSVHRGSKGVLGTALSWASINAVSHLVTGPRSRGGKPAPEAKVCPRGPISKVSVTWDQASHT